MKKTQAKRQRIPRRGPGVAELEKILKEQEGGASNPTGQDISSPTPPCTTTHSFSLNPPRPPPPPPPPPLVPRDYASWLNNLPLFPTLEFIPPPLPTTAAEIAKTPMFPTTRISETQLNFPPQFFPSYQYSASSPNVEYNNSTVNINAGGSVSSCPSSAATSPAERYYRQIEHPSSQISTDFNNTWTSPEEQEKMVSTKRVRPFMEERHREANNNNNNNNNKNKNREGIFTNMATKDSSSSSSSSMEINCSPFLLHSNFRGTKRDFGEQLMRSTKSYKLGDQDSNLMALRSSSSSSNLPPNYETAPFNFHLSQEIMEGSQHRDEGGCASDYYKVTFNSSLHDSSSNSRGNKEIVVSSRDGAEVEVEVEVEAKAEAEGIDLNLKL